MSNRRKLVISIIVGLLLIAMAVSGLVATNYKHLGTLLKVYKLVNSQFIEPVKTTQLVDGAIKGMVDSLNDPYSVYMEPKTFKDLKVQIQGSFGGVGISVGMVNDHITVISPIKGTPAFRAGIKSGDIIVKVDNKETLEMDMDSAVNLMRGKVGSKVKLVVIRKGANKPLEFELVREIITVPSVEGKILNNSRIAYLQLHQFNTNSPEELDKVVKELGKDNFDGMILDLRNNPGGDLDAAVGLSQYFVPKGLVVSIKYRNGTTEEYHAQGRILKQPLVVLVNGGSASASEILSGAVKDTKAGVLVGTKTFGKGVVQSIFELNNGAGLKLTTAKYYTPKGRDIHKKGIEPEIKVPDQELEAEDFGNPKKDAQMARAIKEIEKLMK